MAVKRSIMNHKRRRRLFLLASATLPAMLHASNNNDHHLSVTDSVLSNNTRMTKSKLRELYNLSRILRQLHSRNELSADAMDILYSLENADRVHAHRGSAVHASEQTGKRRRRLTDDRRHKEIDHQERYPFKEYRPNLRRGLLSPKVEPMDEQQEHTNQNERNLEETRAMRWDDRLLSSSKSGASEIAMDWATYPPAPAPLSYNNYMWKSTGNTLADNDDDGNDENFAETKDDDDTGVDDGLFEEIHYVMDYEECYEYQDLEYDDDGAHLFEDLTPVIIVGGDSGKGSGDEVENDNEEDAEDHKDEDEEDENGASRDDDKKDDNEDCDHKGEDNKDDDMDSNGDENEDEEEVEEEEDEKEEDEEVVEEEEEEEDEEEEEADKDDDKENEADDEGEEQNETGGEDEEENEEDGVKNDDMDPDAGDTNTETPSISSEPASPTTASDTTSPTSISETASPTTASETDSPTTTLVNTTSPSIASATDIPSISSVTISPSVTTATTSPSISSDASSPSNAPASIGPSIVSATVSPSIVSATTSPSISSTTDSTESPTFTIRKLQNTIYVYDYAKSGKTTKSSKHDRAYLSSSSSSSSVAETSKDDDVLPGNNVVFVTVPNKYHGKSSKSAAKSGKTKSGKKCFIIKKDDEEVEISDGYCGKDFDHASSKCEEKCTTDADCSGKDSCFGGISECSPKPEEEGDKYCGEDASDASKCTDKCEVDSDCPNGESCYSDVTECMEEVKDQYCGTDLVDATKCATKCESDDDCSGDESCFADVTDCSEGEESSQPTGAPTQISCPEGCIDCDPEAPLLCPPPELKRVCDKHNNELYPPGDPREGEREANFIDCYEMCKPSFCCIHDSASKEYAPSCSQEFENCPLYYPCYIIWWKLSDTIGPATYMRVEQDEPFYEGIQFEYFQQDFVQDQTFFQQFFGHHFDTDDAPTDDTFENEENW